MKCEERGRRGKTRECAETHAYMAINIGPYSTARAGSAAVSPTLPAITTVLCLASSFIEPGLQPQHIINAVCIRGCCAWRRMGAMFGGRGSVRQHGRPADVAVQAAQQEIICLGGRLNAAGIAWGEAAGHQDSWHRSGGSDQRSVRDRLLQREQVRCCCWHKGRGRLAGRAAEAAGHRSAAGHAPVYARPQAFMDREEADKLSVCKHMGRPAGMS